MGALQRALWTSVRTSAPHDSNTNVAPGGAGGPVVALPEGAPARAPEVAAEAATTDSARPDFLTQQSVFTFAGGTAVITILWALAKKLGWEDDTAPPIVFAGVYALGMFLWGATATPRPTRRENVLAFFLALINGAQLALAALGTGDATGVT